MKKHPTKAKFTSVPENFSVKICGDTRCGVCSKGYNYLETGDKKLFRNNKIFRVNANMTCKSTNLIYCITCVNCHEHYIGQTGNSVNERVRVHKEQIKRPEYRKIPLSEHLDRCGKGKFKIMPLFKCNRKSDIYREEMERHLISIFRPMLNAK